MRTSNRGMFRLLLVGAVAFGAASVTACGDEDTPDTGGTDTGADTGGDTSMEDTSMEDTSMEDTSMEDTTMEDTGGEDTTVEDTGGEDTTVEDAGGEDTGGEVLVDQCINEADLAVLATVDATGEAQGCGLGCLGDADPGACAGACVADATGLSEGCSSCYADIVVCSIQNCLAPCAADPSSEACTTCQAENCVDAFNVCVGEIPEPAPVDACLNEADLDILGGGEVDATGEAQSCGLGCLGDADPGACSQTCVEDATGLTGDCSSCYADIVVCSIENCLAPCAADPSSEACTTCQTENCTEAFGSCAGRVQDTLLACGTYCGTAAATCTGDNALYDSEAACREACLGFSLDGTDGDVAGDTVQCRITHLGLAADAPETHCPHAGADGGGVCVD